MNRDRDRIYITQNETWPVWVRRTIDIIKISILLIVIAFFIFLLAIAISANGPS